jgi:hypothetical protein
MLRARPSPGFLSLLPLGACCCTLLAPLGEGEGEAQKMLSPLPRLLALLKGVAQLA